ncbi:Ig-like domain-containing protein [Enterobacteriaceae bacterium H16N7]|nr:Ig-like domain-containing protein [Dryocola clanedunensis]
MANNDNRNANSTTLTDAAAYSAELPGNNLPTPGAPGLVHIDDVNDNEGSKQGDIGHFGTTDDLTPTLQGTLEGGEGLELRIYGNTEFLGTTVIDENGNWSFTPDALEGGSKYTFEVLLKDPLSDNILVSQPYTVITTAANGNNGDTASVPEVDGIWDDVGKEKGPVHSGDTTDDSQPTVFGKADAGSVVVIYDDGKAIGSVTANDKGNWTFTPETPLADGEHSITAAEVGADGTPGAQSPATDFTVDTAGGAEVDGILDNVGKEQGPVFSGDTTDDSQPTAFGKADAGSVVVIYDNGQVIGSTTANDKGNWTFTPETPLADGEHSITAAEVGADGTPDAQSPATDFTVDTAGGADTTPPAAATDLVLADDVGPVQGPVHNGDTTDDAKPTLSGQAEPGATVIVSDNGQPVGSAVAGSDGKWNFTPDTDLKDGAHSFTTVVVDAAANQSLASDAIDFTVKTVPSDISIIENFESSSVTSANSGATMSFNGFEFTWGPAAGYSPESWPRGVVASNTNTGEHLTTPSKGLGVWGADNNITLLNDATASRAQFKIGELTSSLTCSFYSLDGTLITSTTYPSHGGNSIFDVDVTMPEGQEFSKIVLTTTSNQWFWLDDVEISGVNYHEYHGIQLDSAVVDTQDAVAAIASESNDTDVVNTQHDSQAISLSAVLQHENLSVGDLSASETEMLNQEAKINLHNATEDKLSLTMDDILSHGQTDMFIQDGKQQLAVMGEEGDKVELKLDDVQSQWQDAGQSTVAGVTYEVYQHADSNAELLVQQGVELHQS